MWLGIDQGSHASRALVFDAAGRVVAAGEAPLATRRAGRSVEHDATQLLESVEQAVAEACRKLGRRARLLEAAGLATQRSTLVCARRRDGAPLTPALSWQDLRGIEDMSRYQSAAGRIKAITGLRLSAHYGVAKLRWCLAHDPAVAAALGTGDLVAAPLASFLLRSLTAPCWRVDPANAARTLLMDLATLEWSSELERLFEVPHAVLPQICASRYDYGRLRSAPGDVPLTVVSGDQSAALYCLGPPTPGTALVNAGTGAFIQAVTGAEPVADEALASSVVWSEDGVRLYVLEGTVNGAGAGVAAMLETLGFAEPPRREVLAAALDDIAAAPLFLNGVAGLGSPDWRPDFRSRYIGAGSAEQKLAAVYESIVFLIVRNLERIRARVALERVLLAGGLARLDWLARQLAALSGLPVRRLAGEEATARGIALQASRGRMGCDCGARDTWFEPGPPGVAAERYRRWSEALEAALASEPAASAGLRGPARTASVPTSSRHERP